MIPSETANSVHVMLLANVLYDKCDTLVLSVLRGNKNLLKSDHDYYGINRDIKINKIGWNSRIGKIVFLIRSLLLALYVRPDIIVTRFPLGAYVFVSFGFPVILDAHYPFWQGPLYKQFLYRYFRNKKNLKRITVSSKQLKRQIYSDCMAPACEVKVVPNGSKMLPRDHLMQLGSSQLINVGFVGSINGGRGIDVVAALAAQNPNVGFHIAGGSRDEIARLKTELRIPKNIVFHGYIDPSSVYRFRNTCDILLAPYHRTGVITSGGGQDSSKYMSPIKLMEYLSAGKAIIASDLKPIRDLLGKDVALLANPENIDEWDSALKYLMENEVERKKMGEAALALFREEYTWEMRAQRLLERISIG